MVVGCGKVKVRNSTGEKAGDRGSGCLFSKDVSSSQQRYLLLQVLSTSM